MTSLRLLFVIDSFGSGGAQRQMVQLAVGLVANGHHVEFFVYAPHFDHFRPVVDEAGIRVHEYEKTSRFSLSVVPALAGVMRRGQFDLVLAYLTAPGVYAELAARMNRLRGRRTPVVVSERGPLIDPSLSLRAALYAHRLADHLVTNSRNNRDELLARWPGLRERSSVIYNGIELRHFTPATSPPPVRPRELGILAIGTLLRSKDALTLLEAIALHRARYGWAPTVSWAGKLAPRGGDAAYEHTMRARITELGLQAHWTWLGERDDIPQLLQTHDVLVHPSLSEGLPNAICEALASGLPVIAAEIGDNQALIRQGETGYLYPAGDADGLAAAIAAFDQLPARRRLAMRHAARAFAVENLGLERCVAHYEALFHTLVRR